MIRTNTREQNAINLVNTICSIKEMDEKQGCSDELRDVLSERIKKYQIWHGSVEKDLTGALYNIGFHL